MFKHTQITKYGWIFLYSGYKEKFSMSQNQVTIKILINFTTFKKILISWQLHKQNQNLPYITKGKFLNTQNFEKNI